MPIDAIKDAAHAMLSDGAWHTAATVTDQLADAVPDDLAVKTYERLVRAGGRKVELDAERIEIGRSRIVREKLQRLVTDGRAEATGTGDDRMFRLQGGDDVKRPASKLEYVPLERCIFDPRLQMRVLPENKVFSEEWVQHLIEMKETGAEFTPLEAVYDGKKYWIFAGFNRGEMYRRTGENSVKVNVYPGTFEDAQLYSLSENSRHGLNRRPEDCRKSFQTLIASKKLLARVHEAVAVKGSMIRTLAATCGISHGVVSKYLKDHKLHVTRDGKIAPLPEPDPKSPARAKPEPVISTKPWNEQTPEEAGLGDELPGRIMAALVRAAVETCGELAVRLLKGEAFGLDKDDQDALCKQVELMSADDHDPVHFGPKSKPVEPVPAPKPQIGEEEIEEAERQERERMERANERGEFAVDGDPVMTAARDTIANIIKSIRNLSREVEGFILTKSRAVDDLRRLAAHHGIPLGQKEVLDPGMSTKEKHRTKTIEHWPTLALLTAVFADVAASTFQPIGRAG